MANSFQLHTVNGHRRDTIVAKFTEFQNSEFL